VYAWVHDFLQVRAVLALGFTAVTLFMFASGQKVPTDLIAINALVVGHYFGNKSALDKPE
jgi:hypothetical protein